MAITIQVGKAARQEKITLELKARKSLDGNIMIFDHEEMDIVIMPTKSKVVTFAKNDYSETVYAAQNRLFEFLKRSGVVEYESIKGGSVYGSLEGLIPTSKNEEINPVDYTIYGIYKFLKEEKPYYDYIEDYEQMLDNYYTHPTDQDSTELGEVPQASEKLGEVPQASEKGSIKPGYTYQPYWMSYMLEGKEK